MCAGSILALPFAHPVLPGQQGGDLGCPARTEPPPPVLPKVPSPSPHGGATVCLHRFGAKPVNTTIALNQAQNFKYNSQQEVVNTFIMG